MTPPRVAIVDPYSSGALLAPAFAERGHECIAVLSSREAPGIFASSFRPGEFQRPWVPRWPGLTAIPIHASLDHPWTERVHAARHDIIDEMADVQAAFTRARYDSDFNPKEWNTYYFYLEGRPVDQHLAACPRTAAILRSLPHNGLHV